MRRHIVALVIVTLTLGSALVAQTQASPLRIIYFPLSSAELNNAIAQGLQVTEDYGGFVVADASASVVTWIQNNAGIYHELTQRTGRGSYFGDPAAGELVPTALRFSDSSLRIVQFKGPIRQTWSDSVTNAGATILSPLQHNSLLVHATGAARDALPSIAGVRWTGAYHPGFRLAPDLWSAPAGTVVIVSSHHLSSTNALSQTLTATGCSSATFWTIASVPYARCTGDSNVFSTLAFDENVAWIEPAPGNAIIAMSNARGVVQGGKPISTDFYNQSLYGQNQLVAVADTGLYTSGEFTTGPRSVVHEMLSDASTTIPGFPNNSCGLSHRKVAAYINPQEGSLYLSDERDDKNTEGGFHGTRMASIIAGDTTANLGLPDPNDGVAPSARLVILDIGPNSGATIVTPNNYGVILDPGYNCGARLQSNSWGKEIGAPFFYTHTGQQIDQWLMDRPEYLALWAMGNSPQNQMLREATAKNVITVGAATNPGGNDVWESGSGRSGRGPTAEGRIKPDLMAAIVPVTTASCASPPDSCGAADYASTIGMTSGATALAAGAMTLLRQYFVDGWYPTGTKQNVDQLSPSASLLRAVALAGAKPMTGAEAYDAVAQWPNGRQGWGRLEIGNAAFFQGEASRLLALQVSPLSIGQSHSESFTVTSSTKPLSIAAVWPDCPGVPDAWPQTASARPSLCSDIQMIVVDPHGNRYVGNNFLVQPNGEPASIQGGVPDLKNVVEMVRIASPATGTWTVHAILEYSAQNSQVFSLAATGSISDETLNLAPYLPDRPTGKALVLVNEIATYTVNSQGDRDVGRPVRIEIFWGDGSPSYISDPIQPTPQGVVVATTHQWLTAGLFDVMARGIDERGAKSDWSESLGVRVCSTTAAASGADGPSTNTICL